MGSCKLKHCSIQDWPANASPNANMNATTLILAQKKKEFVFVKVFERVFKKVSEKVVDVLRAVKKKTKISGITRLI